MGFSIVHRMAEKDFYAEYSIDEIKKMSREEHFYKLDELEVKYGNEFYNNGLKKLKIQKK